MIPVKINEIQNEFKDFIIAKKHPCIMANAVFKLEKYQILVLEDMNSDSVIVPILDGIEKYLNNYDFESNDFESLILCFPSNHFLSEIEFEKALWQLLQRLHDRDSEDWDPQVSNNVEDPTFSFSLKGKAFYVIGMHPNSSRIARKSPYPTLVMNLHWQFEKLREMGTYQMIKKRIRRRDKKLQGTINPVLRDFGKDSEAKQYSGREVNKDWRCPFHTKNDKE